MNSLLMERIDDALPGFSKGQKLIANFFKEHYDQAAYMTAAKLGATVGVSESTVVRFATEIGFEGYPQLQKAIQEMVRNRLTSVQRMEVASQRLGKSDILNKVLQNDIDAIKKTMEETNSVTFHQAVEAIINSRRIYIIGVRSAAALSSFMSFYFTHIFEDVRNIDTASTSMIFEQMMRIGKEDVFIGITFSRYSRRTLKAAAFAKSKGATVIAITDSSKAPIAEIADCVLVARSGISSFVDSLAAPLSLINALIVAIGLEKKDQIADTYAQLERIWDEYNVYEQSGGSQPDED